MIEKRLAAYLGFLRDFTARLLRLRRAAPQHGGGHFQFAENPRRTVHASSESQSQRCILTLRRTIHTCTLIKGVATGFGTGGRVGMDHAMETYVHMSLCLVS